MDPENKFWKYEKHTWRHNHFTHVHHKCQSYDVWFLRYHAQETNFLVTLDHFLLFYPPNNPKNQNLKKWKNTSRDIIIWHNVYHKWQSYDIWFLRYEAWQIEFFVILDQFLLFYPLRTQKIKILKIWKIHPKILSFYKWQSYYIWFLRYGAWPT